MKNAVRYSDSSTGHSLWHSSFTRNGSNNVFINNLPSHRVGDYWEPHCAYIMLFHECHHGTSMRGSPTVFVNNRSAMRVGDAISCGDTAMTGSPNVFIGP